MRCFRETVPGNYIIIFHLPGAGILFSGIGLRGFFTPVQPDYDQKDSDQRSPRGRVDDNDRVCEDIFKFGLPGRQRGQAFQPEEDLGREPFAPAEVPHGDGCIP